MFLNTERAIRLVPTLLQIVAEYSDLALAAYARVGRALALYEVRWNSWFLSLVLSLMTSWTLESFQVTREAI